MIGQDHKRREIFILCAKAIADPAAHARKSRHRETSGLQVRRGGMNACFANQVMHKSDLIHHGPQIGHHFAQRLAALSVRPKFPGGRHPGAQPILEGFDVFTEISRFALMFDQCRFVIEQIDMTGCSGHEQLNHPLGLGRMVQRPGQGSRLARVRE